MGDRKPARARGGGSSCHPFLSELHFEQNFCSVQENSGEPKNLKHSGTVEVLEGAGGGKSGS